MEIINAIKEKFQVWFLIQRDKYLKKELAKIPSDNIDDYYFDNLTNQFIYKDSSLNIQIGWQNTLNVIKTLMEITNISINTINTAITNIEGHQVDLDVNIEAIKDLDIYISNQANKGVIREGSIPIGNYITEEINYQDLLFNRVVVILHAQNTFEVDGLIYIHKRNADDSAWFRTDFWYTPDDATQDYEAIFSFSGSEHFRVLIRNDVGCILDYKVVVFFSKNYSKSKIVDIINSAGLALKSGIVITSADEDLSFTFGRVELIGIGDYAEFKHKDAPSYAINQYATGRTYINTQSHSITFMFNATPKMYMFVDSLTMKVPIKMESGTKLIFEGLTPTELLEIYDGGGADGGKYISQLQDGILHIHGYHRINLGTNEGGYSNKLMIYPNSVEIWVDLDLHGHNILSSGALALKVSGDNDDYLKFYTYNHIPKIKIIGGDRLHLESDHASQIILDFNDGTYTTRFFHSKTDGWSVIQSDFILDLKSVNSILLRPSNDNDDYISFSTITDIPQMSFIGGNGLITNVADPTNAQDVATKNYVDTQGGGSGANLQLPTWITGLIAMTRDSAWHDIDISGTYGASKHLVFLYIYMSDNATGQNIAVRPKDSSSVFTFYTHQVRNIPEQHSVVVQTDSSGVFQYKALSGLTIAQYGILAVLTP